MHDLGKRFLKEYVPGHCKPNTAEEYHRSVELFIDPRIGDAQVPDVQRSHFRGAASPHAEDALSGQPDAGGRFDVNGCGIMYPRSGAKMYQ